MALTNVAVDDLRYARGNSGATLRKRIGMEGGVVTVEETDARGNVTTRAATAREIEAYTSIKDDADRRAQGATLLQALRDATTVAGVRDAVVAYIEQVHPEDA